jgi:hypothetical protein
MTLKEPRVKRCWIKGLKLVTLALILALYFNGGATNRFRAASAQTASQASSGPLPAGPDLIAKMQDILKHAGSVHIDSTLTVSIPNSSRTLVAQHVDYSWRDSHVSSRATTRSASFHVRPATTTTAHSTTLIVGSREASRSGRDTWSCGSSKETLKTLGALLVSFLHVQGRGARTLGAETIAGMAVWHVRATAHVPFLSGAPTDQQVDLYLAQSDARVIKQTLATTGTGQPTIYITVANRYTGYGTSVRGLLPAACAEKG